MYRRWMFLLMVLFVGVAGAIHFGFKDVLSGSEVGERLFSDRVLSASGSISCASCHQPNLAFTDGYRRSTNAYGARVAHNAPTLYNLQDNVHFNWSDPGICSIEDQLKGSFFHQSPGELEYFKDSIRIKQKIWDILEYRRYFMSLGLKRATLHAGHLRGVLAQYIRTLQSRDSKWDLLDRGAWTQREIQGHQLFFERYKCNKCHGGIDFDTPEEEDGFYVVMDKEHGPIRIPTLRNVAITRPYYHDGRFAKMGHAIRAHEMQSGLSSMDDEDCALLVSFLMMLTDTIFSSYAQNPTS